MGVPQLDLRQPDRSAAGRPGRARDRVPRLRQHRPHARGLPPARGAPHPQHRPPPRQHALRHGQPGGAGRVVHGGDRLAALEGARGRAHPRDRRAALHRPRDRHRPLHVREHRRGGSSDGRRPDHGGRGAAQRVAAPLRGPALQPPRAAAARARDRRAPRPRRAHRRAPREERLRGDGRIGDRLRGRDRPPARRPGHARGGTRARAARRGPRRAPEGQPARHRQLAGRVADRPHLRRRGPHAGRRLHHRHPLSGVGGGPAQAGPRAAPRVRPGRAGAPQ